MVCSELKDLNYSAIIARRLATVHQLNVPINKEPTWLFDTMNQWKSQIKQWQQSEEAALSQLERQLIEFDYESDLKTLALILAQCESPVVFCHNDLQEGNILLPSDENISKMLNSNKAQQ